MTERDHHNRTFSEKFKRLSTALSALTNSIPTVICPDDTSDKLTLAGDAIEEAAIKIEQLTEGRDHA